MPDALVWILVAGVLLVGEVLTLAAVAGLLAGGALAAFGAALLTDSLPAELGVFAVVSILLLVLVRPIAVRSRQQRSPALASAGIVGTVATVTETVDAVGGQVRLHGELWRARPEVESDVIPVGSRVLVHAVHGATVHIYPVDPLSTANSPLDPPHHP